MTIVDSNVLLDVIGADPTWRPWSVAQLDETRSRGDVSINGIIYAEIAPRFGDAGVLDAFLEDASIAILDFSRAELFLAGRVHRLYRQRGGERGRVLPDFLIGAQARIRRRRLLTRDERPFRTYFPDVRLITPSGDDRI